MHELRIGLVAAAVAASLLVIPRAHAQDTTTPAATPTPAATTSGASSGRTGFGVGAAAMLGGLLGPSLTYDAGAWHIDGIFAIEDFGDTAVRAGARFLYVLHRSNNADFSVGGGAGISANGETVFLLEGGAQIRAFITSNVALVANLGLAILFGEDDTFFLTPGQLQGSFGVTYYFF